VEKDNDNYDCRTDVVDIMDPFTDRRQLVHDFSLIFGFLSPARIMTRISNIPMIESVA
jgi:hypothetical protein